MADKWKLPPLSRAAWWIAAHLPNRVYASAAAMAYEHLYLNEMGSVQYITETGGHHFSDGISSHELEGVRRRVLRHELHAS